MKKRSLVAAVIGAACLVAGSVLPVSADGMKVVTIGADLSQEQQDTMFRYFQVDRNSAQVLYITNQDERKHLGASVPLEQIGTRTVSCAYVKPTNSGGIKVRTANLNWVTGNMIATTLSTSGVKNCEVIAACPFEVSGTGALCGITMAYETASGQSLDPVKKELAVEEMMVTGNLADDIGKDDATNIVNQAKIEVIQNNYTNVQEITNVVNNVTTENNVTLSDTTYNDLIVLMQKIAEQDYEYDEMRDTLEHVDVNVNGEASVYNTAVPEEKAEDTAEAEEDAAFFEVDESVLGENVAVSSTEDPELQKETYADETPASADSTTDDSDGFEAIEWTDDTEGNAEADQADDLNTDENGEQVPQEVDTQNPEDASADDAAADLSEQSRSQYEKAEKFFDGVYEGNEEALDEVKENVLGEDFTPSVTIADPSAGEELTAVVSAEYMKILSTGYGSAATDGTEPYFNDELNQMYAYLQKLFGRNGQKLDDGSDYFMIYLTPEEKEGLYQDTVRFFEKLYGEEPVPAEAKDTQAEQSSSETYESQESSEASESDSSEEGWDYEEESYDYE